MGHTTLLNNTYCLVVHLDNERPLSAPAVEYLYLGELISAEGQLMTQWLRGDTPLSPSGSYPTTHMALDP